MSSMVTIGGVSVDAEDPCALWQVLYAAKLKLLAGERVEETEIRSPVTSRRMKVSAANLQGLDEELGRLAQACAAKTGGPRARFAKRMKFI